MNEYFDFRCLNLLAGAIVEQAAEDYKKAIRCLNARAFKDEKGFKAIIALKEECEAFFRGEPLWEECARPSFFRVWEDDNKHREYQYRKGSVVLFDGKYYQSKVDNNRTRPDAIVNLFGELCPNMDPEMVIRGLQDAVREEK